MLKITTLAILAGLVTATSVAPSFAQFAVPGAQNHPTPTSSSVECDEIMGHMRSVRQADINAIHGNRVSLQAVCEDLTVLGKNAYGSLFVNGNVNHLRVPIARNATLMAALTAKGYDQHDVVSLRHGANDSIILYVHQRDMN
ncbi:hypothetical protein JP75_21815 [Devosia riboflavina]|uniref:DUF3718 domain-containing protein n=1 Tax=Devosia riboflavina TaxID=46914 RepID=A0A087LXP7_9HYPH|nr:hypothetical protein [Devosia riboflavina]KFL29400.1 hypothetical protein JP75_21815 [Devosia riboflavina]